VIILIVFYNIRYILHSRILAF